MAVSQYTHYSSLCCHFAKSLLLSFCICTSALMLFIRSKFKRQSASELTQSCIAFWLCAGVQVLQRQVTAGIQKTAVGVCSSWSSRLLLPLRTVLRDVSAGYIIPAL